MKSGATNDAAPMATPTTTRPAMSVLRGHKGGAQRKDGCGHDDDPAAPETVGEDAGGGRTDDGADQDGAHYDLLHRWGEAELLLDEENCSRDDAGIVAEEEAAEGSHAGGNVHKARARQARRGRPGHGTQPPIVARSEPPSQVVGAHYHGQ